MGLALFRKLVAMHANIQTIYANKIVEMISAERSGNTIEKSILKSLTSMFTDLNVISLHLFNQFLPLVVYYLSRTAISSWNRKVLRSWRFWKDR